MAGPISAGVVVGSAGVIVTIIGVVAAVGLLSVEIRSGMGAAGFVEER